LLNHFGAFFRDVLGVQGNVIRLRRARRIGGMLLHLGGHVRGKFHHFAQAPAGVIYRVVVGFKPHRPAVLIHAFELAAEQLTLVEALPELGVGRTVGQLRRTEQAMMLALDLREAIAHALQEVSVGRDDGAVEVELDHRHGPVDRLQFGAGFALGLQARGHVQGELNHLYHVPCLITDWVVAGFQPHRFPIARLAFERSGLKLAIAQVRPQLVILGAAGERRCAEHSMGLAHNLLCAIAHGVKEIVIGPQYIALRIEFDHRHGALDGIQHAGLVGNRVLQGVDGFFMGVE